MSFFCICAAKESAVNRLKTVEFQCAHVRIVVIYSKNDFDSDDFCVNISNSDFDVSINQKAIHFRYLAFLQYIKWIVGIRDLVRTSKVKKLEMTGSFDDVDKHRHISIVYEPCSAVHTIHFNNQKLLIDEYIIDDLHKLIVEIPSLVEIHRELI